MARTKLLLALALGALTLLPAAAAQAATTHLPATFLGANITATCTSGSGEFPCEPGQVYSFQINVQERCDGVLSGPPGGIAPSGLRDDGRYSGAVNGTEADGAHVSLQVAYDDRIYVYHFELSPNQSSFTGDMLLEPNGAPIDGTGEYSVTGQRTVGPLPGCSNSAPAKKCKKQGKKSQAQSAKKKKKCKKKH
jgi:hypothetical protein